MENQAKHYDYSSLPKELKNLNRFVLWKKVERKSKTTKVPYTYNYSYKENEKESNENRKLIPADITNPETWLSFEKANEILKGDTKGEVNGIGFVLGDGYSAIDLDHCVPNNIMLVKEFNDALHTYMEYSQSGKGVHFLFKMEKELPPMTKNGDFEFYSKKRYIALTGKTTTEYGVSGLTITHKEEGDNNETLLDLKNDIDDTVLSLYNKYMKMKPNDKRMKKRIEMNINNNAYVDFTKKYTDAESDGEIVSRILNSAQAKKFSSLYYDGEFEDSQSEADLSLCCILAFWTNKNKSQMKRIFETSNLMRDKWNNKDGDKTYGDRTIDEACEMVTTTVKENWSPCLTIKKLESNFDNEGNQTMTLSKLDIERSGEGKNIVNDYALTERGMAKFFTDICCRNIKYVEEENNFIYYDHKLNKWVFDNKNHNYLKTLYNNKFIPLFQSSLMKEIENDLKKYYPEDSDAGKRSIIRTKYLELLSKIQTTAKMNNIINQVSTFSNDITVSEEDLDKYPYLLCCNNGVVDLRNGAFYGKNSSVIVDEGVIPVKKLLLTQSTKLNYLENAKCPRWEKFVMEVCKNDKDLAHFFKVALGYTLTGETSEQVFFECLGRGGNGKSVMFNVIYNILGDYATTTKIETILASKDGGTGNNATPEIAKLKGKRFLNTSEPDEASKLKEGEVKDLTGGGVISARKLYGESFSFKPEFKLWIQCNYKIRIMGRDDGIWRRTLIVPFNQKFVSQEKLKLPTNKDAMLKDSTLEKTLKNEYEGILKWLIDGAKEWYSQRKLDIPSAITVATEDYKREQDIYNRFIMENLTTVEDNPLLNEKNKVHLDELWECWKQWTNKINEGIRITRRKFVEQIKDFLLRKDQEWKNMRDNKGYYFTHCKIGLQDNTDENLPF